MNTKSKIVLALVLLTTLAALALPAAAQTDTRTLTLAEEQINQSYRVTASPRRSVDNTYVDLQPGQVVISATLTFRPAVPMTPPPPWCPSSPMAACPGT